MPSLRFFLVALHFVASSQNQTMTVYFLTLLCLHVLFCLSCSVSENEFVLWTTEEREPASRCTSCMGSGSQTNTTPGSSLSQSSHIAKYVSSSARSLRSKPSVVTMFVYQVTENSPFTRTKSVAFHSFLLTFFEEVL